MKLDARGILVGAAGLACLALLFGPPSASAKSAAAKSAAAKSAAAKNAGAKNAGTKSAGAKNAVAKNAVAKNASTKSAAAKSASTKSASAKSAVAKNASAKNASAKNASAKNAVAKSAGAKSGPVTDREEILAIAEKYIGAPYLFGGASPAGFDCSGYTKYVFGLAGYRLPRGVGVQYRQLYPVKAPRKGDLVFYRTYTPNVSHVGIYVGDNRFLHAPSTGKLVGFADMTDSYWRTRYVGARSVLKD